jgi:hypothetical protein
VFTVLLWFITYFLSNEQLNRGEGNRRHEYSGHRHDGDHTAGWTSSRMRSRTYAFPLAIITDSFRKFGIVTVEELEN